MTAPDKLHAERASLRGRSAELLVAAAACEMGHTAALVLSFYAKYDLVIDADGRLLRVQVKLAQWISKRTRQAGFGDRAHWQVSMRQQTNQSRHARRRYTPNDFDLLAVVCQPGRIYFLPTTDILGADGQFLGCVRIKPEGPDLTRADSQQAAERWAKYLNVLPEDLTR